MSRYIADMALTGKEAYYIDHLCVSYLESTFINLLANFASFFSATSNSVQFLDIVRPLASFLFCHILSLNMISCTKNKDIFFKNQQPFLCVRKQN